MIPGDIFIKGGPLCQFRHDARTHTFYFPILGRKVLVDSMLRSRRSLSPCFLL